MNQFRMKAPVMRLKEVPQRAADEVRFQARTVARAGVRAWEVAWVTGDKHEPSKEPWVALADLPIQGRQLAETMLASAAELPNFMERAGHSHGWLLLCKPQRAE